MQNPEGISSYRRVHANYLKRRQLNGQAGWFLLWGLGVGAVISGDFYGWNYGLDAGGFWGLAIATFLMAIMYLCMVFCLAELSAALPHAGGLYSFTRNAFGPFWGFICGIAVSIEYILATAALVLSMSNYLKPVLPEGLPSYIVWLVAYSIFMAITIQGLELTLNVSLFLTLLAIMVLSTFYISLLGSGVFNPELLFNIPPEPGQASWLPKGWNGVFASIPYAIWFYLAIELLPLASEETENVPRNMPIALITGMVTLIILSVFTLVLNSGIGGGALAIGQTNVPLGEGLEAYFGKGSTSTLITALSLALGLGASLPTQIFGYGRILFSLSRAGYIPQWISVTNKNYSPYRALILGTTIGLICVEVIEFGSDAVDAVFLNMAVFGALISYILVMFSYIKLKFSRPRLLRPYESPLGILGAVVGVGLAIFALVACLAVPAYRPGIFGVGIILVLATLYYFFFSKNQIVAQAPEEAAALGIPPSME